MEKEYKKVANWVTPKKKHGLPVFPEEIVMGGMTADGETLYVARAEHDNDTLPGKVQQNHSHCYVGYNGEEYSKESYKVLVNPAKSNLDWVAASGGSVPAGALQGGRTAEGEALFIGRCKHGGDTVCGKSFQSPFRHHIDSTKVIFDLAYGEKSPGSKSGARGGFGRT
ncbi:unnamed protein product [Darwinula stevensoni]|uniref:DUF3421 domain-containing protein n=1 Tax=Darwinula stevensoni TaxID=69355 RepID=A0A7R9AF31_9CRUS|nr:unnamed protein product [Darwinula stevensoni]CAG0902904.1 unnamed protein product [Darwinula stevensoni]